MFHPCQPWDILNPKRQSNMNSNGFVYKRKPWKKEIRVSLSLREQLRELEGDMDETSLQLRAVAENTGNLSSVPMKHFALYKTSYVSATNNKKLVVGDFAYRSQNRDYKLSWERAWNGIENVLNRVETRLHCRVDDVTPSTVLFISRYLPKFFRRTVIK